MRSLFKKYTLIAWVASLNFCFDVSTQISLNVIACLLPKPVLFKLEKTITVIKRFENNLEFQGIINIEENRLSQYIGCIKQG